MSSANYCPHCGAQVQSDSIFCASCGRPVVGGMESSAPLPFLISPTRIVLLSILSFGIYTLYWFYKTWSHYKEHTRAVVYPVWHGLTLIVPIYGSFRAHAHMRSFAELATAEGIATRLAPGWAFGVILVTSLSGWARVSPNVAIVIAVVGLVAQVWLMIHAQASINYFWSQVYGSRLRDVAVGKGEILISVLGVLLWLLILAGLFVEPEVAQNGV